MFRKSFPLFVLMTLFSVVALYSCKKENTAVAETQWFVDDYIFQANNQGGVLLQTDTGAVFGAGTSDKDLILIGFKSNIAAGTYKLANTTKKTKREDFADDECALTITHGKDKLYMSLYDDGGVINITQSGKKYTATFNNVRLGYIALPTTDIIEVSASGKIVEK